MRVLPEVSKLSYLDEDDINHYDILMNNISDIIFREYFMFPEHMNKNENDDSWEINHHDSYIVKDVKICLAEFCERLFNRSPKNFIEGSLVDISYNSENHRYYSTTYEMFDEIYRYHTNTETEFKGKFHDSFIYMNAFQKNTNDTFFDNSRTILNEFCKMNYNVDFVTFMKPN